MIKNGAIIFLLIVCAGLFLIASREHRAPQVSVDLPHPITPAASPRRGFVCTPTLTPRIRPVTQAETV